MPYRDDLACERVVGENGKQCGVSPARAVPIININLCERHQEEMSKFFNDQLGEDGDDFGDYED